MTTKRLNKPNKIRKIRKTRKTRHKKAGTKDVVKNMFIRLKLDKYDLTTIEKKTLQEYSELLQSFIMNSKVKTNDIDMHNNFTTAKRDYKHKIKDLLQNNKQKDEIYKYIKHEIKKTIKCQKEYQLQHPPPPFDPSASTSIPYKIYV